MMQMWSFGAKYVGLFWKPLQWQKVNVVVTGLQRWKEGFLGALLALALASAGSTVRMPQQDASVDMWCNLGRPQRGTVAKRKTYTENPHFHMNERHEGRGTSHQIPSGGGLQTQQSVVCSVEERAAVCFALAKRGASMKLKGFFK